MPTVPGLLPEGTATQAEGTSPLTGQRPSQANLLMAAATMQKLGRLPGQQPRGALPSPATPKSGHAPRGRS